jgi:hypothetical protein
MTKFEQLIEKDIENGTFHSKNIYCKEYLQPMFFEYGINLEKENEQLKQSNWELLEKIEKMKNCSNCNGIIKGGMRTERCKFCIKDKDFRYWELAE